MSNWSLLAPVSVAGQRNFEARDKTARIGSQSNGPFAETKRAHVMPLNAGRSRGFGKSLVARECVVEDAVGFEPVSKLKFPNNREKYRENRKIKPVAETQSAKNPASTRVFSEIHREK
jgi:hypothetical protein